MRLVVPLDYELPSRQNSRQNTSTVGPLQRARQRARLPRRQLSDAMGGALQQDGRCPGRARGCAPRPPATAPGGAHLPHSTAWRILGIAHSGGCVSGGYAAARVQRCVEDPRTSLWRQRSPAQCQHVAHAAFS